MKRVLSQIKELLEECSSQEMPEAVKQNIEELNLILKSSSFSSEELFEQIAQDALYDFKEALVLNGVILGPKKQNE